MNAFQPVLYTKMKTLIESSIDMSNKCFVITHIMLHKNCHKTNKVV